VRVPKAIDTAAPDSYWSRKRSTLGSVITFTSPGVPMIFQGEEMLETNQFSSSRMVDWSKTITYTNIVRAYRDITRLRRNLDGVSPGLKGDQVNVTQVDNSNKLIAYRRWKTGAASQDIVVVANFANSVRTNYSITFPRTGVWYVQFNSDSTNYGADYGNVGPAQVTATGSPATAPVTIGRYSALILSQTPPVPPLTITKTNGIVTVAWTSVQLGWVLASTPTMTGTPPPWTQVPTPQYQTNATMTFVTLPQQQGNIFYRLRKP
jgi:1,4-alpha-glucan branching enzyme